MTRLPARDPAGRGMLQGTNFVNHGASASNGSKGGENRGGQRET